MTATLDRSIDTASLSLEEALQPVRLALLADAELEADRIIAAARTAADESVAGALSEADAEVERARDRAERSARAHTARLQARVLDQGRRTVLAAKEQLRRRLVDDVHDAALELREDPRYPLLLDHLEALAVRQLGDDAVIERDPEGAGGLIARTDLRRVDYRLASLADRALDALADEVGALWD